MLKLIYVFALGSLILSISFGETTQPLPVDIHTEPDVLALFDNLKELIKEKQTLLVEDVLTNGRNLVGTYTELNDTCKLLAEQYQNSGLTLEELVDLVEELILTSFNRCLRKYPGVWIPLRCLLFREKNHLIEDGNPGEICNEESISSDAEDDSTAVSQAYDGILKLLQKRGPLNTEDKEECSLIFGENNNPSYFTCASLIRLRDVERFIKGAHKQKVCKYLFQGDDDTLEDSSSDGPTFNTYKSTINEGLKSIKKLLQKCNKRNRLKLQGSLKSFKKKYKPSNKFK